MIGGKLGADTGTIGRSMMLLALGGARLLLREHYVHCVGRGGRCDDACAISGLG